LFKVLNDKKYIFNTVNSGHILFFRASANCSKILKDKTYFNAMKNIRANSVFQGRHKLLKSPVLNVKIISNTVKHFRANSVFHDKRKLLKNP